MLMIRNKDRIYGVSHLITSIKIFFTFFFFVLFSCSFFSFFFLKEQYAKFSDEEVDLSFYGKIIK